ncbi:N-acetylneuraminate synthase family protein [bacterium]|nr:N-acetylneuraminate synthase family protein [bacterium]
MAEEQVLTDRSRPYIIAEAGINHGGDMQVALEMVSVAGAAGVNAVKFQSFTAGGLTHETLAADQHEFFAQYELSRREHLELAHVCRERGVDFLSTPFDFAMADMLAELDVPAFKIASCDLTNLPLIRHCGAYGRPLYISTGMGDTAEVQAAYEAARNAGSPRVVMLQCTTNYPTAYADVNLLAMQAMREAVGCAVGFSDHSIGNWACFAAVALGAEVIEKHFCLDKAAPGPDIAGSCSPLELQELVTGIRAIVTALGSAEKSMRASEQEVARIARRSIYYARDMLAGHRLEATDLRFLRPAGGMSPARSGELIGQVLTCDVKAGAAADAAHVKGAAAGQVADIGSARITAEQ